MASDLQAGGLHTGGIDIQDLPSAAADPISLGAMLDQVCAQEPEKLVDNALKLNCDPEEVEKQLVKLVLVVVELIRRLMEAQALNRMERGTLNDNQIDQLGETLFRAKKAIDDMRERFNIPADEFNIDLGPLGTVL